MKKIINYIKTGFWFIVTPWWCLFDGTLLGPAPGGHTSGLCHGFLVFACVISLVVQAAVVLFVLAGFGIFKLFS